MTFGFAQVLVNSVLLRSQTNAATGVTTPALSPTSPIRKQTEQTRLDIIRWLRKRWLNVRMASAFDPLEDWALKEISDGGYLFAHTYLLTTTGIGFQN